MARMDTGYSDANQGEDTMAVPVALQLYTVRDALAKGFEGVVRQVAEIGYAGVEVAGFGGTTPAAAARLFKSLGLQVPSIHTGPLIGDAKQEVFDILGMLDCKRAVSGYGPDDFKTLDLIRRTCEKFNQSAAACRENGLTFSIHNHWWEFEKLDGRLVFDIMLEHLDPDVLFEIDTYWVQTGGADPATEVRKAGKRAPLLHIKDGPCEKGRHMTAVGEGKVDFHAVAKAGGKNTEWMIVELDSCETDMLEAVRKSYVYLTANKLARGTK